MREWVVVCNSQWYVSVARCGVFGCAGCGLFVSGALAAFGQALASCLGVHSKVHSKVQAAARFVLPLVRTQVTVLCMADSLGRQLHACARVTLRCLSLHVLDVSHEVR